MKKHIYILLLFVVTFGLFTNGQEIKIKSFSLQMEPMTVPMQRTDNNGNVCALVKVQIPIRGVQFEGNIVGPTIYRTNEYWVYLTHGTKQLNVKVPEHYTKQIRFDTFDEIGSVASKKTYCLVLVADEDGITRIGGLSVKDQFKQFYESIPQYSLMCKDAKSDTIAFYDELEWDMAGEKSDNSIYGVVLKDSKMPLIVKLIDEGKPYETFKWSDSYKKKDTLPILYEAEILYQNKDSLNKYIAKFGGHGINMLTDGLWTRSCTGNSNWVLSNEFGVYENSIFNKFAKRQISLLLPQYFEKGTYKINNFSLKCDIGGVEYYFTEEEWNRLSSQEKRKFNKHGIVVFTNENVFLLDLEDKSTDDYFYNIEVDGKRLPSQKEALYLMSSINRINSALKTFGGAPFAKTWTHYWIQKEIPSNKASTKDELFANPSRITLPKRKDEIVATSATFIPANGIFSKSYLGNIRLVQDF